MKNLKTIAISGVLVSISFISGCSQKDIDLINDKIIDIEKESRLFSDKIKNKIDEAQSSVQSILDLGKAALIGIGGVGGVGFLGKKAIDKKVSSIKNA